MFNFLFHNYLRYEDRLYFLRSISITGILLLFFMTFLIYSFKFNLVFMLIFLAFMLFLLPILFDFFGKSQTRYYSLLLLLVKQISLFILCLSLFISLKLWYSIDSHQVFTYSNTVPSHFWNFGVDVISIHFIPIICLIFLFCYINYWNYFFRFTHFILLAFLYLSILLVFLTLNAFIFYVCFELTLIPMVIMLLEGGHRARRIKAMYYFFLLTLFGSFCLLFGIIVLYLRTGSFNFEVIQMYSYFWIYNRDILIGMLLNIDSSLIEYTFETYYILPKHLQLIQVLLERGDLSLSKYISLEELRRPSTARALVENSFSYTNFRLDHSLAYYVWFPLAIGFAVKIPIFPFHIWLPEAHVEAPTIGSVILASLLLKLGGYGFYRFLIFLLPSGINSVFVTLFNGLCLMGIVYASLIILIQTDLKKIIAYSSIAHMNFAILGLLSFNIYGLQGGFLLLISHCFVSAGLFFAIGVLYERYHTRHINSYSGLSQLMPMYSFFFLIFNLSNFAFPGTSSFCAELLILIGLAKGSLFTYYFSVNFLIVFLSLFGVLFSAIYSMYLFSRVIFGTYIIQNESFTKNISFLGDLEKRERFIFICLVFLILLVGFYPQIILHKLNFVSLFINERDLGLLGGETDFSPRFEKDLNRIWEAKHGSKELRELLDTKCYKVKKS